MVTKRIVLNFPPDLIEQPIAYHLVKDFDLEFNILKADVNPKEEGLLVLELKGENVNYKKGIDYLKKTGIQIQPLDQDVIRNEDTCTHCGACVGICPTGALSVDSKTREIIFDDAHCIACELCVPACPPRAMEVHF